MPHYNHDMLHCSQERCKLRDKCYRYWLGKEIKNTSFKYASFYYPEQPVTDGCEYFCKLENY